jgi:hypothetical protein
LAGKAGQIKTRKPENVQSSQKSIKNRQKIAEKGVKMTNGARGLMVR